MKTIRLAFVLSAVLMAAAEDEPLQEDDVDRTDFSDPALSEDKKILGPSGPHSEVEPASMLVDLYDGKVSVGAENTLLVSLANMGAKMFNVSHMKGTLSSSSGAEVQALKQRTYGEPLGPREQRSFRFLFEPKEDVALGTYNLTVQVFYNNRDKDQFVDTVYSEMTTLGPKPPDMKAKLRLIQGVGGGVLLLLLLAFVGMGRGSGKSKPESSKADAGKAKKAESAATAGDEWLSSTLAGTENLKRKKVGKK